MLAKNLVSVKVQEEMGMRGVRIVTTAEGDGKPRRKPPGLYSLSPPRRSIVVWSEWSR